MAARAKSHSESEAERGSDLPEIVVCESCPGRSVFLEAGNTDGWISSDLAVDVTR